MTRNATMNEEVLYGIYLFPNVAMHRADVLERLVDVLRDAGPFEPQTWGTKR